MAGNLLNPQSQNYGQTTVKSLKHCIFKWKIQNISVCLASSGFSFYSSPVDLTYGSKWCLGLYIEYRQNICYFRSRVYRRSGGSNIERIKVRFRLKVQLPNGYLLWNEGNQVFDFDEGSMYTSDWSIDLLTLQRSLLDVKNNDALVIIYEMLAVVTPNEISGDGITFSRDIVGLSRNFIKLLKYGMLTNMSLLVEGKHINAHKEILSIWSEKFTKLLETCDYFIEIQSFTYEVVIAMLIFLYSGGIEALITDDPPPIELCECAEYYRIAGLADLLQPREIVEEMKIGTEHFRCSWHVLNFHNLWSNNAVFEKIPDEERFVLNSDVKVRLDYDHDGMAFSITVSGVRDESVILYDIKVFDAFYNSCTEKRYIAQPSVERKSSFELPLDYFNWTTITPPYDTLTIRCDFTYMLVPLGYSTKNLFRWRDFDSGGYNWNILSKLMKERFSTLPYTDVEVFSLKPTMLVISKRVHKSVLCARSPLFEAALKDGKLYLPCSPRSANALLYYIYTGTLITYNIKTLIDLYELASEFQIRMLMDKCIELLQLSVTFHTACNICLFANRHGCEYLKRLCFECIFQNKELVLSSSKWRAICRNPALKEEILAYID